MARGYQELWRVERVHRDSKHTVDIRLAHHRLEDRIRAHVLLCWLALVLIQIAEQRTSHTWHYLRAVLDGIQAGHHRLPTGKVWQTTPLDAQQKEIFQLLDLKPPGKYLAISVEQPAAF